jgi:hypothetical protein
VRAGIATTLGFAVAEPDATRLLSIDVVALGPDGAKRMLDASNRLAALLFQGRDHGPGAGQLPELTEEALVGMIWTMIGTRLMCGEPERLAELEPQLVELALLPYLGAAA